MILESLYATALRRFELAGLKLSAGELLELLLKVEGVYPGG
ncbi:MAG TPA: hypothetical protein VHM02_04290 [Thermoanaerobaculia bacterium]|nr:hypothetical protein [Thermoanaerobaculia bacterium]